MMHLDIHPDTARLLATDLDRIAPRQGTSDDRALIKLAAKALRSLADRQAPGTEQEIKS